MRDTLFLLGRILLVAIFFLSGVSKLMNLGGTAAYIGSKGLPAPDILAILAGAGEVVLALLIVVGFQTRLAAIGLAVFTVAATVLFHDFWNMQGPERMQNMISAQKNLSIIGALLMLAVAGAGRYAMDRNRHADAL
jgi:putative oxidoreductase